ncbi:MAG: class E sortase [Microbacteriaceae bacterium]
MSEERVVTAMPQTRAEMRHAHGTMRRMKSGRRSIRSRGFLFVAGELIITAGVLVLLFVGWQQWFNDLVVGASQQEAAVSLTEQWSAPQLVSQNQGDLEAGSDTGARPSSEEPAILPLTANQSDFAVLIVPRFGEDFRRTISSGVSSDILNSRSSGVGHYSETNAPGELGNFAIAAHRTTHGRSFHDIGTLVTGDHIFVETIDGWYRYVYRNSEYVRPSGVGVLAPLPQFRDLVPNERILTMTSCNPLYSAAERIIAYSVMDAWFPREGGVPVEILVQSAAVGN